MRRIWANRIPPLLNRHLERTMHELLEVEEHLSGKEIELRSAGDGRLIAVVGGRDIPVHLRQCFPWSEPRMHLSLRDDDQEEVALVEDPNDLEPGSRSALEAA